MYGSSLAWADAVDQGLGEGMGLSVQVFVIENHVDLRSTLVDLLRAAGYRTKSFASGEDFFSSLKGRERGCIVADLDVPDVSEEDFLTRVRSLGAVSPVPVIFLTESRDLSFVVKSMRQGAFSLLAKPWAVERLLHEVNEAYEALVKQDKWTIEASSCITRLSGLSKREQTIVDLIVDGNLTKEIAADLNLSEKTVENHRRNILKKTGARCVADLVRMAVLAQIAST